MYTKSVFFWHTVYFKNVILYATPQLFDTKHNVHRDSDVAELCLPDAAFG